MGTSNSYLFDHQQTKLASTAPKANPNYDDFSSFFNEEEVFVGIMPDVKQYANEMEKLTKEGQQLSEIASNGHSSTSTEKAADDNPIMNMLKEFSYRLAHLEHAVYSAQQGQPNMFAAVQTPQTFRSEPSSIRMRDLDRICYVEFALQPHPTNNDLSRMAQRIEGSFPGMGRRQIVSSIRKWYRKRRDENGQKVFSACIAILQPLIGSGLTVDELRLRLAHNPEFLQSMLDEAALEITNQELATQFMMEKIEAFFARRVLHNR